MVGLHDILHAIVMRISSVKTFLWLAASSESSWWRFTANHRTIFTDEMRITIACNISCSPNAWYAYYICKSTCHIHLSVLKMVLYTTVHKFVVGKIFKNLLNLFNVVCSRNITYFLAMLKTDLPLNIFVEIVMHCLKTQHLYINPLKRFKCLRSI